MFRTYISETLTYHDAYYTVGISKYSPITLNIRKEEGEMLNCLKRRWSYVDVLFGLRTLVDLHLKLNLLSSIHSTIMYFISYDLAFKSYQGMSLSDRRRAEVQR